MMKKLFLALLFILTPLASQAENQLSPQQISDEVDRIKLTALDTFKEYLAIPNDGHMHDIVSF